VIVRDERESQEFEGFRSDWFLAFFSTFLHQPALFDVIQAASAVKE